MGPFLRSKGVWLKTALQVGLSATVCSHDAFAMHQTAIVFTV